jgi:hypothetical protein
MIAAARAAAMRLDRGFRRRAAPALCWRPRPLSPAAAETSETSETGDLLAGASRPGAYDLQAECIRMPVGNFLLRTSTVYCVYSKTTYRYRIVPRTARTAVYLVPVPVGPTTGPVAFSLFWFCVGSDGLWQEHSWLWAELWVACPW